MQIRRLTLTHFRNFTALDLAFTRPVTAFVGQNGQGKTNLLEAIFLLALGKSLRASSDQILRQHGASFFRVAADCQTDTGRACQLALAAGGQPYAKTATRDGQKILLSELVGRLPAVAFFPEEMNLLLLGPALRRRHLDAFLAQTDPHYLAAASRYQHALRQRGALLISLAARGGDHAQLDFWENELAVHGSALHATRQQLLAALAGPLAAQFTALAAPDSRSLTAALTGFHPSSSVAEYTAHLRAARPRDLRLGATTYGPHRADLLLSLAGVPVAESGSRGEVRSAVLALKLAELQYLETQTGERPLLLLDDVFSELDSSRQEHLLASLAAYQTVITTTKLAHLDPVPAEKLQVWHVRAGTLAA